MFCPRCGREGRGLCIECFLKDNPIGLKPLRISLCKCGNYLYWERWRKNIRKSIKDVVEKNLQASPRIKVGGIRVRPEFKDDRIDLRIYVNGEYAGEGFTEELNATVKVVRKTCPDCVKLRSGYYESILQLRTKNTRPELDIDTGFVSNVKKVRGGFDFYLTSTQYARQLKKNLLERGFSVRESAKLFGVKDGKKIYRVSISVKEPPFSEGDFIRYKRNILQLVKLGRRTLCRDVVTRKEKMIPVSSLKDSRIVAHKTDLREGVVTMVSPSEVQVLDLEDNKTHELKNEGFELEAGQDIDILKIDKKIYIL